MLSEYISIEYLPNGTRYWGGGGVGVGGGALLSIYAKDNGWVCVLLNKYRTMVVISEREK